MGFLTQMLSSEAKISSKRTVGFAAFMMLMASWGADTFTDFEVKDKKYYPRGTILNVAYDNDMEEIKENGYDDEVYHYVDDDIDLKNIKVGEKLMLDVEFTITAKRGIVT